MLFFAQHSSAVLCKELQCCFKVTTPKGLLAQLVRAHP